MKVVDIAQTATKPVVTGRVWREGKLTDEKLLSGNISDLIADPNCLVWVDLCEPTPAQLQLVGEELNLDAHTLEDALSEHERPKATRFEGYTFSTFATARRISRGQRKKAGDTSEDIGPSVGAFLSLGRVSAYALPTCLLTVRRNEHFDMEAVLQRWSDDPELVRFGVDGLLQGLLDVVIDEHFAILQDLDDAIEDLIDIMFADKPDIKALQRRTFEIRRELVALRRVIAPMRDIVATLIRAGQNTRQWSPTLLSYYEDLNDHALRAADWLESLRDLVSTIYDTNLSLNDTRMNEVMKKLAAWAAIVAVPTLITGWFGMNVPYWGYGSTAGFAISGGLVIIVAVVLFISFKHRDWL
jgi:magnesium transporter